MRLILDNVSKRDYEWLLSMAKALNFKVTAETSEENTTLEKVDRLLEEEETDTSNADFKTTFGISDTDIAEFRQRKADYQSGKDKPITWD